VWTKVQDRIGAGYVPDGNPGGVEGPAVFANHHNNGGPDDEWYLFVDVIPSIGYRPMVSRDLDQGWMPLQADDYFLTAHTKHGGVASLTRAEYDRLAQHVHAF
ncbi:1,4-beta-xylanase, partial [Bifidobacterium adolescentis]